MTNGLRIERESRAAMKRLFQRGLQKMIKKTSLFIKWPEPELLVGDDVLINLPQKIKGKSIKSVVIVTTREIREARLLEGFLKKMKALDVQYKIFDEVESTATIATAERIAIQFNWLRADAMIAIGDQSVMDATKAAGMLIRQPYKEIIAFRGLLNVGEENPFIVAVPTVSGTGSEANGTAVVLDHSLREPIVIIDPAITPALTVLDAHFTRQIPNNLVGRSGMETLSVAIEAYISHANTEKTKKNARKAIRLIATHIKQAHDHLEEMEARQDLLRASYYTARATTQGYFGNVQAMTHVLATYYSGPKNPRNATILPIVLRMYGEEVVDSLQDLAYAIGVGTRSKTRQENAAAFIAWIEGMNQELGIPNAIPEIRDEDVEELAKQADEEANPLYPVPVIFHPSDFKEAFLLVKGEK